MGIGDNLAVVGAVSGRPGYTAQNGIFVRPGLVHDEDQYDTRGYQILANMQKRHFWYRGRHRFLANAVRKHLAADRRQSAKVIDLGAGCGGWIDYAASNQLFPKGQLAVGDSSLVALESARGVVSGGVDLFQIDLLDLRFEQSWDAAFLLDVIEHLDDDVAALTNAARSLVPGGLLFVTVPALKAFWSWNDELAHHRRRYDVQQLRSAGESAGLVPVDLRYFMFLLSPLLFLSRALTRVKLDALSDAQKTELAEKEHEMPSAPVNATLAAIFGLETPLSRLLRFPWGTSLLGVFRKPH